MFLKKCLLILFLMSIFTHAKALQSDDHISRNLESHSYPSSSAMGSIATEVGKLVSETQLQQTWGDSFAGTVNGTSHGFAKRQANQEDLKFIIPALAAIAIKNPKRDMWAELSRGNIRGFTPEQQEHILNAYTIISLFQKLNKNGLLVKTESIQEFYQDLFNTQLTEALDQSFQNFGNDSLREKVTRFVNRVVPFSRYIPSIPEPFGIGHYQDIHDFHISFNPRATRVFAAEKPPFHVDDKADGRWGGVPAAPSPRVHDDEHKIEDIAQHKLEFAETMAFESLNDNDGAIMEQYAIASIAKNRPQDFGNDPNLYITGFLFSQNPKIGMDYGLMGQNGLHIRYALWNRMNLKGGKTSPGFLGLQRGYPYNFSHEENRKSVFHNDSIQQFINDAESAFVNGYISYAAIVRNANPNDKGGQHFYVILVTKNDDNTIKDGYVFNPTGAPSLDLQSVENSSYRSILLALKTQEPNIRIHGRDPVLVSTPGFDGEYKGELNAIMTGLQSGTNACGITATMIAEYLVTLRADQIRTRADVIKSLKQFQREFGYNDKHLNEQGLFDATKLTKDEREGDQWIRGSYVDGTWYELEPYFQPGIGRITKHGDYPVIYANLVKQEKLFGDETVRVFDEIYDIANKDRDFSTYIQAIDKRKHNIFKNAMRAWIHGQHQAPAAYESGNVIHRKPSHLDVPVVAPEPQAPMALQLQYDASQGVIRLGSKHKSLKEAILIYNLRHRSGGSHNKIMEDYIFDIYLKPDLGNMDTEEYQRLCHRLREEFIRDFSAMINPSQPQAASASAAAVAIGHNVPAYGNISDILNADELSAFNGRLFEEKAINNSSLAVSIAMAWGTAKGGTLPKTLEDRLKAHAKAHLGEMGIVVE